MTPSVRIQPIAKSLLLAALGLLLLQTAPLLSQGYAGEAAKAQYLAADHCLKQLKKSAINRQKVSSWLSCISRYENIYTTYPSDSWAPAGMFKAAELYLQLFDVSKNQTYEARADDLLARLKNKYPDSAYRHRAETLLKLRTPSYRSTGKIKTIKSKKEETRNDTAMVAHNGPKAGAAQQPEPVASCLLYTSDAADE